MEQLIEFIIVVICIFAFALVGALIFLFRKNKLLPSQRFNESNQKGTVPNMENADDELQQILGVLSSDNDYKSYDEVMNIIIEEYPDSYKTKGQIY